MKRFRFLALLMSAMLIAGVAVSCKDDKDKAKSSEIVASDGSKLSGIVSPDSESDEAELGDYRVTESGTKVYYDHIRDKNISPKHFEQRCCLKRNDSSHEESQKRDDAERIQSNASCFFNNRATTHTLCSFFTAETPYHGIGHKL